MISLADLQRRIGQGRTVCRCRDSAIDGSDRGAGQGDRRLRLPQSGGARGERRARCAASPSASRTSSTPPIFRPRWARRSIAAIVRVRDAPVVAHAQAGGRDHRRQDHDHGLCRQRSDRDAQSAQSRPHAGRIVVGLGGLRRRRDDPAGAGHADRRLGDPAGLVLRRGRDQAELPAAADRRRQMFFVDARHRRAVRGRRRRPRMRSFGDDRAAGVAAAGIDRRRRASAW